MWCPGQRPCRIPHEGEAGPGGVAWSLARGWPVSADARAVPSALPPYRGSGSTGGASSGVCASPRFPVAFTLHNRVKQCPREDGVFRGRGQRRLWLQWRPGRYQTPSGSFSTRQRLRGWSSSWRGFAGRAGEATQRVAWSGRVWPSTCTGWQLLKAGRRRIPVSEFVRAELLDAEAGEAATEPGGALRMAGLIRPQTAPTSLLTPT